MSAVIQPKAQDRLYELIEREQLPGDVRETLAGALTGDLPRQQLLFQAMIDTWPRLQKNLTEVARSVSSTPWEIQPYSEQGNEATDSAIEKARMVQTAIENMSPRPAWDELSERGLVKSLVHGYYMGHQVCEVFWDRKPEGTMPRSAKIVPPRFYDYPDTGEDRLMFSPDGGFYTGNYEDFPEHHFVIAVNRGHGAHPSIAAPLRALTGYWLAATFGLKWLLQFAQLYGVPFRWAEYEDETVKSKVCNMLENIGSAGWGAFPKGTKLDFVNAGQSADSLPQAMLLEMADRQCDTFILGQTLTTDVGDSGSRALGDIHQEVRAGVMQGINDFIGDIYNHQLIPSIIKLNYGSADELPKYSSKIEAPKDEIGMAQRDQTLISMGMEVGKEWLYERHGVPMPEEGDDDIFSPGGNGAGGDPQTGNSVLSPNETPSEADPDNNDEEVEASMVRAYDPNQKRAEKGSDNGGQWVKDDGTSVKGDEPKKSRGLSDKELARHAELEAKHDAGTLTDEERDEAQELVDKAARLAGYDVDNPMYHGTTHDFETFDPSIGSPEGDFGRGNYLTSSLEDAEANYAGGGPDLKSRIELGKERYFGDNMIGMTEADAKKLAESQGIDWDSIEPEEYYEGLTAKKHGLARAIVSKELHGGDDRLITAYTKLDNPAMIGENADGKQMYVEPLEMYDEEAMAEYKPEAEALVRKEYELDSTDDIADYSSEVREAQEEWADNNSYYNEEAHPLQEAVRTVSNRFSDVKTDGLADLDSVVFEGGSYADVADTLRQKVFQYATNDDGDLVTGEAVRQVFEEMGHDAVIDYRVDDKFKNMAGNYEGNYHIISFKSSQIKSANIFTGTPLAERFDDKDDRITFSHAVKAYDPNQKRGEKGSPDGGRWVKEDGEASPSDLLDSPDNYYDSSFISLVRNFENFKDSPEITSDEAALLLAFDKDLFDEIDEYKSENTIDEGASNKIAEILDRVKPVNKQLYRGVLTDSYDKEHPLPFQSWSANKATAEIFAETGGYIKETTKPVKGVELGDVYYYHNQIFGGGNGLGDTQAEWLVLSENFRIESANAKNTRPTIDQLSDNVLESLTGVTREWLSPVRPHFEKLAAMAMSKNVSDADFIEALEKSQREMPELFDKLNVEALQTSMEDAIGTAMIVGSVERYEADEVKAYDPNQKRGEAGTPQGGRWVKDDGAVVSVSDKDISYWSSYGQNRSFDSEAEAKNWVFRSLNRIDDSASGAIFGKKGEAYNRAFADSLPVYKTDEGFKVGTKLDEPKDSMGWDEIEIEGSTLEDVTTNGLANPFDAPSISPVKNIAINEIQKTESHSDTDAGMEYVSSLASSIKESERFKAILLQGNGDDGYVILDGHHRFEAAKLLEMDDIPSQIISFRDEDDDRITFSHAK